MTLRTILCVALAGTLAMPASAAPIELTTRILKEQRATASDGTTGIRLVPARKAVPGDRLVYVLTYRNTGRTPVTDLVLDNPLPADVAYRAPGAGSPPTEVSVDGRSFGALGTLVVRTTQGTRRAAPDDVTHLRWRLPGPVAPGGHGEISFNALLK